MSCDQSELFSVSTDEASGAHRRMWKQVDEWAAKSKAEYDQAATAIHGIQGWKFSGVEDGVHWAATHRMHGRIKAGSSAALLAEIHRIEAVKRGGEKP